MVPGKSSIELGASHQQITNLLTVKLSDDSVSKAERFVLIPWNREKETKVWPVDEALCHVSITPKLIFKSIIVVLTFGHHVNIILLSTFVSTTQYSHLCINDLVSITLHSQLCISPLSLKLITQTCVSTTQYLHLVSINPYLHLSLHHSVITHRSL